MSSRIGYLIPEFPGQTHAFFMREREELEKLGKIDDWMDRDAYIAQVAVGFRISYTPWPSRPRLQLHRRARAERDERGDHADAKQRAHRAGRGARESVR